MPVEIFMGWCRDMKDNKKIIVISVVVVAVMLLIAAIFTADINNIIKWIENIPHGLKEVLMMGIIALQILIAVIPGEPLELACGYMFGSVPGTLICMLGSLIGTVMVFFLVRFFGVKIVNLMFKSEKIDSTKKLFEKKKNLFWVFVLFLIPATPKDVMTYLMSLTNIKLGKWLVITTVGRIPSIVTSTFLTGSIKSEQYLFAGIVGVITVVVVIAGALYFKRINGKDNNGECDIISEEENKIVQINEVEGKEMTDGI